MSKVEHPLQALANYLPTGAFEPVVQLIHQYKVHLTVTRERKSVLGDYRHPFLGSNHKITVNGNLNKYEFLITLLHELAHLLCFEQFRNRVEAHGKEWKNIYGSLLKAFIDLNLFPEDITKSLKKTLLNPAATANVETALLLVLRRHNPVQKAGVVVLAHLADGSLFKEIKGRTFRKIKLRRKRIECIELATGNIYLFSALSEVEIVNV
ncbi:MAG: SprT-like domain-containing protein [Bacteroidetes bacterium]|nr:SprT-like domain-containing protein [Bacteroidota bacterium]